MEKLLNKIYNVLYYIVLLTSFLSFILFIYDPQGYKYITSQNKWNKTEYIEQQVFLVLVIFLSIVALYIFYKRNLKKRNTILYYLFFLLVVILLLRGIFVWSNSGFDHTF